MAMPTGPQKRGLSKNARIGIGLVGAFVLIVVIGRFTVGTGADDATTTSRRTSSATSTSVPATTDVAAAEAQRRAAMLATKQNAENYRTLTPREFALVAKDPDAHKGELISIYGKVTQFDAATGSNGFRANTGPLPPDSGERYELNSVVRVYDPSTVADVVEDDYLLMYVEVAGAHTYDTSIGGKNTAPMFDLYIVRNLSQELEQRNHGG